jgi:hypothetical protein
MFEIPIQGDEGTVTIEVDSLHWNVEGSIKITGSTATDRAKVKFMLTDGMRSKRSTLVGFDCKPEDLWFAFSMKNLYGFKTIGQAPVDYSSMKTTKNMGT